jgi:hypothetical protein
MVFSQQMPDNYSIPSSFQMGLDKVSPKKPFKVADSKPRLSALPAKSSFLEGLNSEPGANPQAKKQKKQSLSSVAANQKQLRSHSFISAGYMI